MRAIETAAVADGSCWEALVDRAGAEVARLALEWLGGDKRQSVLVLAGPGNNGGDALVVARHLADRGWPVSVFTWSRPAESDGRLRAPLTERKIGIDAFASSTNKKGLLEALRGATVVIDGLLGTGIKRDVTGALADLVQMVNSSGRTVISVDIPTGVDGDTGAVHGVGIRADLTVAIGHVKYGHILQPGAELSGKIVLGDIGLSTQVSRETAKGELLGEEGIRSILPKRPDDANKGTFGRAMVVAGSINFIGAAVLATQGAMRVGTGLVTLACAGDLVLILAAKLTESTFLPLPSDMGAISAHAIEKVRSGLKGYSALLLGSGIGQDRDTVNFVRGLLSRVEAAPHQSARSIGFASRSDEKDQEKEESTGLPQLVIDGDALNILSGWDQWQSHVPEGSVLTPHPGEMARLLDSTVEEVQKDRVALAAKAAADWKQVVVLKGAATIVAEPGGKLYVSPFSNPALATAGTGDVLAGAIAGLIAQGLTPVDAARAGVYLHGLAGELLREQFGVAGGLAGDLPVLLALAQRQVRGGGDAKGK